MTREEFQNLKSGNYVKLQGTTYQVVKTSGAWVVLKPGYQRFLYTDVEVDHDKD